MQSKNPIFEKNYHAYLNDLSGLDLSDRAEVLDITVEKQSNTTSIPYFGQKYSVSVRGSRYHSPGESSSSNMLRT